TTGTIRRAFWARVVLLAGSLIATAAALAVADVWVGETGEWDAAARAVVLAGLVAQALSLHAQSALQAAKPAALSGVVLLAERLPLAAGIGLAAAAGMLSVTGVGGLYVASSLLAAGGLAVLLPRRAWLPPGTTAAEVSRLATFSLPYVLF